MNGGSGAGAGGGGGATVTGGAGASAWGGGGVAQPASTAVTSTTQPQPRSRSWKAGRRGAGGRGESNVKAIGAVGRCQGRPVPVVEFRGLCANGPGLSTPAILKA